MSKQGSEARFFCVALVVVRQTTTGSALQVGCATGEDGVQVAFLLSDVAPYPHALTTHQRG